MLYIVSGASRSGKTKVAKALMHKLNIPYMSLDWLVMGFTNGVPEYGIHDKLWPNEIAQKFWPFLQAMCENMLWSEVDYIVEGEAVLPELITNFIQQHPKQVRICFLGYTNINTRNKVSEVKQYSKGIGDWLINEPEDIIHEHIENMIGYSKTIQQACKRWQLPYIDTSNNFESALEEAVACLLKQT